MAQQPNFLLGNGHRLTADISIEKPVIPGPPPYSFTESKARLAPQIAQTAHELAQLPEGACPDDYAVGLVTIHPEYTAKSYFPATLLREARLEPIGSRPGHVQPTKWKKKKEPEEVHTTQLYVAGRRADFSALSKELPQWSDSHSGASQLFEIEAIRALRSEDRLHPVAEAEPLLELVLHTTGVPNPRRILEAFEAYTRSLDLKPDLDRRFEVGGLCFVPMRAARKLLPEVGKFAFLRAVREMPGLRPLQPLIRSTAKTRKFAITLPQEAPLDNQLRAAVFDGGLPAHTALKPFATCFEPSELGAAVDDYLDHGTAVTSAALFGSLERDAPAKRPYGLVDHYRVLDDKSDNDPYELYDTLIRIRDVLQSRKYAFVNLSIGPALPVEDHDVHAWTAVLDDLFSDGETLTTIAVGNDGEQDWASGNARVQVPSDSVNALAVGAANTKAKAWERASYSCIGPGRSPGLIKPDLVAFGGSKDEPFYVFDQSLGMAVPLCGTSFAAPYALRAAMGIRAHFGTLLSTLAIKALLVHSAEPAKRISAKEVGWGRLPERLEDFVICPAGIARVVYQGELTPAQYLRTPIPLPSGQLQGMVSIAATFCFACETDPQDPSNYTRGGLDVTFRPHADKFEEEATHPKTSSFFRRSDYDTEKELRHDAHKWETTLHRIKRFQATSLKDPFFDVHYQVRQSGRTSRGTEKIRYALIITVSAPKVANLYNRIVQRYRTQLQPLVPVIEVPIQVR
jgi:hypothetical protein